MKENHTPGRPHGRITSLLVVAAVSLLSATVAFAKPVAEQIKGHWGLDAQSILAAMKPDLAGLDEAQRPLIEASVKEMATTILVGFGDEGKATVNGPEGEQSGHYKMEEVDEKAASFMLTVAPDGQKADSANATLAGDKLTLKPKAGPAMIFLRITKEEYDRRKGGSPEKKNPENPLPVPVPPTGEPAPAPDPAKAPEKPE